MLCKCILITSEYELSSNVVHNIFIDAMSAEFATFREHFARSRRGQGRTLVAQRCVDLLPSAVCPLPHPCGRPGAPQHDGHPRPDASARDSGPQRPRPGRLPLGRGADTWRVGHPWVLRSGAPSRGRGAPRRWTAACREAIMNLLRSQCMQRCDERSEAMHVTIARPFHVFSGIKAVSEEVAATESSMLECFMLLLAATLLCISCQRSRRHMFALIFDCTFALFTVA